MQQREGLSPERIRELVLQVKTDMATRNTASPESLDDAAVASLIDACVSDIAAFADDLDDAAAAEIKRIVTYETTGYGALQPFIDDDGVTEIMVNGHDDVFVESAGIVTRVEERLFEDDDEVKRIIDKIAAEQNKHCDINTPDMDARLSDGSRVNAVIPPVSLVGPCLTIRKFPKHRLDAKDLVNAGSISYEAMCLLLCCVQARCNILVSGGTGSGKTTLLNILSSAIPQGERVITIEDTAELQLTVPNWVRMEARAANAEGEGEISIHRLLVDSLRMRPDRIIVGECRSDETAEMLQAMNTGHDGSLTTIHANDPRAAFLRIKSMVQMAQNLSEENIAEQIMTAIQLVVQTRRFRDGTRKVSEIVAVTGRMEGGVIETAPLIEFVEAGLDEDGFVTGSFEPTGNPLPESIKERIALSGAYYDNRWLMPL